jgi:hypothetical protein
MKTKIIKFLRYLLILTVFCLIIRLCINVFGISAPVALNYPKSIPPLLNFVLFIIFICYQLVENLLWIFLYYFSNLVEDFLKIFNIVLESRPHLFTGSVTLVFLCYLLWWLCNNEFKE